MASITNLEKRLYSLTFTDELNVITSLVELQQQLSTATDAERRQMKERLLRSNVPRLLCATLKQDFSNVPGTWSHVTRLSNLLVIMVQVPHSSNPFLTDTSKELLSDITESMLILLRRLQKRLSSARSQSEKMEMSPNEFIVLIKKVLADLRGLVEWHVEAAYYIANSPWFLQLFIVDDPQLMEWFTTLLVECVKRKPSIVEHWSQNQKVNILDELIYHFAVIDSLETVDQTLHCLLTLLTCDSDLRLLVLRRYRGIHLLVTRWLTHCCSDSGGVESQTDSTTKQKLLSLLEILGDKRTHMPTTQSESRMQSQTGPSGSRYSKEEAAAVIQAAWKGACTRKKLQKAHKGFALFQKRFRERRTQIQYLKQKTRMEAEFQHFVRLTRRRRYREQLELEFRLLNSLPAPLVDRQQSQKREEAATIIQAFFRGFHVRFQLAKQKEHLRKDRAARIIQRHFRQHLSRLDCLATTKPRIPQDHLFLSGEYSEADRKLAKQRHQYWCDTHPVSCKSREQLEQLHRTVQQHLKLFQVNRIKSKLQHEVTQANQARIAVDAQLLLSEPSDKFEFTQSTQVITNLARAVESHQSDSSRPPNFSQFQCRTQPLVRLAQQQHRDLLVSMGKPWWTLTMRKWQRDRSKWFEAHENRNQDYISGDEVSEYAEEGSAKWLDWLPDRIFDDCEDELCLDTDKFTIGHELNEHGSFVFNKLF